MSPSPRAAYLLGAVALSALVLPAALTGLALLLLLSAAVADLRAARRAPVATRKIAPVLSRGVTSQLVVEVTAPAARRVRVRQAASPDLRLRPSEDEGDLRSAVLPTRRGRHRLEPVAVRTEGPLGLARADHRPTGHEEVLVYPDMPGARRLVIAVRQGRFREQGLNRRGPLGLGTEFESVRDYSTDDDIRQVNWRATARLGRPMSNDYRVEQDRDVICVVDTGRLMAAPVGRERPGAPATTRLDSAIDAVAAVGLVADESGDRCGAVAFDTEIRRLVSPRRQGGVAAVRALYDVEPRLVDADYDLAFRAVKGAKRAFVLVLTDLLEETAAGPLIEALPVLARRHAVVVAGVTDPELERAVRTAPHVPLDLYRSAAAIDLLDARERAATLLRGAGAVVLEAPAQSLPAACVRAYLSAKARARL